ncbi:MAG: glycoside hydrolase family 2 TIM barrel-domain containing protein [Bacteroidota bacterium]
MKTYCSKCIGVKGFFLLTLLLLNGCTKLQNMNAQGTISEIRMTDEGYRIFLNDEPFFIKGAGVDNGDIDALANHGANSLRTWSTENGEAVLDKAHKRGLKVMMGIWVGLERHGFDYDDEQAVSAQLQRIRERVIALKDHPALMIWGIGNEMNLESQNPKVWDAVNDIAKMIHEIDPNRLTTTPLAGIDKKTVDLVKRKAPEVDFISVQVYGAMDVLPELILDSGYNDPLLITEWGATGYWEVEKTEWGAPLENHSSKKADLYLERYQKSILGQSKQVMGSFVFLWGQKQERTPTWFGMFMPDGNESESVDMMHYAWNNEWPQNRSPRLIDFTLEGKQANNNIKLKAKESYSAEVRVQDPDDDELIYRWEIRRESQSTKTGGDTEYIPEKISGLFYGPLSNVTAFNAPGESGAYRLFIYVKDGNGHTAHANIPFWVEE